MHLLRPLLLRLLVLLAVQHLFILLLAPALLPGSCGRFLMPPSLRPGTAHHETLGGQLPFSFRHLS
jgi:hypothetical protein